MCHACLQQALALQMASTTPRPQATKGQLEQLHSRLQLRVPRHSPSQAALQLRARLLSRAGCMLRSRSNRHRRSSKRRCIKTMTSS